MPLSIVRGSGPSLPVAAGAGDEEITLAYLTLFRRVDGDLETGLAGLENGVTAERSLTIAVRAAGMYLAAHDVSITLRVPEDAGELSQGVPPGLREYVAGRYRPPAAGKAAPSAHLTAKRRPIPPARSERQSPGAADFSLMYTSAAPSLAPTPGLDELLAQTDAGFSETLLRLIDESGCSDPEIYKRANIDRKLFSKIRSNPSYRPSKSTALALAFALRLNLEATRDLIGRAGYTLTHANRGDIIVEFFIENGDFDIYRLNETLFRFDQPLLGGA